MWEEIEGVVGHWLVEFPPLALSINESFPPLMTPLHRGTDASGSLQGTGERKELLFQPQHVNICVCGSENVSAGFLFLLWLL